MRRSLRWLCVIAFLCIIGCGSSVQDPVAPGNLTFDGEIAAELDASGLEALLGELILIQQRGPLYTYEVDTGTGMRSVKDINGNTIPNQYYMYIAFVGKITAGSKDINIRDAYVNIRWYDVKTVAEVTGDFNKVNIIPDALTAGSSGEIYFWTAYKGTLEMNEGFKYELVIEAEVDTE